MVLVFCFPDDWAVAGVTDADYVYGWWVQRYVVRLSQFTLFLILSFRTHALKVKGER